MRKEDVKEGKKVATNEPKKPNKEETDKADLRQSTPEERVTVPKDWMKRYKAKRETKKDEVNMSHDAEQRESNQGLGREPEMKEPQTNGPEVENQDTAKRENEHRAREKRD